MGAEVILMHVISDPVYYSSPEIFSIMGFTGYNLGTSISQLASDDELKKHLYIFLINQNTTSVMKTIQTLVEEGDFAESILKTAKDLHVDIIVMGSHSRRWLDDILMGSVTTKVFTSYVLPLFYHSN